MDLQTGFQRIFDVKKKKKAQKALLKELKCFIDPLVIIKYSNILTTDELHRLFSESNEKEQFLQILLDRNVKPNIFYSLLRQDEITDARIRFILMNL